MFGSLYRAGVFTLYQTTLVLGIVLMPLVLMARHLGVRIPLGDLVEATTRAYENAKAK
ncbi:hypothetical protein [Haloplanus halobius]|uniref:hypothetical protein n=1 Tax=Haloplanus halobius TaxID=2934938 RepID=UPI00200BEA04|nr:hypothetical protein [Haloplanus sp. XH21]